jgi:predicted transcriptional regulator
MAEDSKTTLLNLTAQIVAAHVAHNAVAADALPSLIEEVYRTLTNVGDRQPAALQPVPAVPIRKSVTPDYIICLEDGRKLKMLRRHLRTAYNMSPEQYREKWGLPPDYPMVAANYAKQRSSLAKNSGLGTRLKG